MLRNQKSIHRVLFLAGVLACCLLEVSFAESKKETADPNESGRINARESAVVVEEDEQAPAQSKATKESTDIEELLTESRENIEAVEEKIKASDPNESAGKGDPEIKVELSEEHTKVKKTLPDESKKKPADETEILKENAGASDPNSVTEAPTDGNEDIEELLEESKVVVPGQWIEDEMIMKALRPYTKAKKYLHDEHQFDVAMEHVLIYQRATGGRRPREQSVYNFTLFGLWRLSKDKENDLGVVGFSFEERDNVTRHSVKDFSTEVGSLFYTHGLNSNERSRTAFRQLWWRGKWFEDRMTLTAGKIHHASYYNRNDYAGNTRTHFLSHPFSRNPNRLMPQDGLGANIKIKPNDDFYISMGFGDARANNKTSGFDTIEDGDLFEAFEFGLTPEKGNYRFTVWHTDKTNEDELISNAGNGFAMSFDQDINKRIGLFGRYGYTEPQTSDMKHFASGGFILQDPWGIKADLFGAGLSWNQSGVTGEDETAIEVFYRIQATRLLQITPSILVVFDPIQSDKTEPVAVFGIRARALF